MMVESGKKVTIEITTGELEWISNGLRDLADLFRKMPATNWDTPEEQEEYAKANEEVAEKLNKIVMLNHE